MTDHTNADTLRTPIVAVLGHVDHGKTSLLDTIRGSAVSEGEAGAITQHIGATDIPLDTISEMAGELIDPTDFDLPGLLFIDTPGHHSFSTLRARGGALADIAVLVVDVNDGFQPQTEEAIDILRRTGTPFVVAANKVDTTPGWNPQDGQPIQRSLEAQSERAESMLNENLYEIIGQLSDAGFSADLYWRVQDFQKNIGVVPLSAITGEGVPDLLTVLMGLSQRFMKEEMAIDVQGPGEGTVLEVKDERGFGATIDTVVYDGVVRNGDQIVVGGQDEPIVTEIRALLQPRPLEEIRTEKKFEKVAEVGAAAGVKIAAPDLDRAMAGAPVRVVRDRPVEEVVEEVKAELAEIEVETAENGVVVKADTLGSLEAMANALREAEVPILRAEVGDIAPRDIAVAETANQDEHKAILGFNVDLLANAETELENADVKLFTDEVIYQLIEDYETYVEEKQRAQQETVLDKVVRPSRFRILPDHTFRQNDPAVVGVEVISGTVQNNRNVGYFEGNEFERVGQLSGIQKQGDDVDEARAGERVSIAIDGPTVGRDIEEGDTLWTEIPEKHAKILEQELKEEITADEREALAAYLETKRKRDPFWGK
ncbi:translation initiation factor IF-2 [Halorubrum lacusprofundi]|jgi:translation initiation factor 5B|uniref:Probable translation initiation factor IF-2 n=1 Tax=Halorubrum lacusprofundi (strain ATCC 49239 / DSM 5036 / JCM 8891 / ACAM 34) TaxID=416348 RepID=IF2P_HALLT|nr:translation initiation factor IF-2 [Halorubrum lacusprofundi]B9LQL7.1 RecName: Full=Probable translation initiation factor IF-2 [Halorubrum lacusprofundi ATCC 49239]ACM57638.1 translation initiation factor aIF-2 [Halorubrum lacusprofundi ATCC 49239]MCG1005765.1 translation initiation factor IF-2 [Halorubrum lacusprofundi]